MGNYHEIAAVFPKRLIKVFPDAITIAMSEAPVKHKASKVHNPAPAAIASTSLRAVYTLTPSIPVILEDQKHEDKHSAAKLAQTLSDLRINNSPFDNHILK